mgnify:CR=1 FL=1
MVYGSGARPALSALFLADTKTEKIQLEISVFRAKEESLNLGLPYRFQHINLSI